MTYNIGYIVGSISSTSLNRTLGRALEKLAPEGVTLTEIPLKDVPFFSVDYTDDLPQAAVEFKQAVAAADGMIIITPEYNHSIPGVLKNALEWAARPYGKGVFIKKPTAVTGATPSPGRTLAAQDHLRMVLEQLEADIMAEPTAGLQTTAGLISESFEITDAAVAEELRGFLAAFVQHIAEVQSKIVAELALV